MTNDGSVAHQAPLLRCLVVDDQPATTDRLARMLRADPRVARVATAPDATSALRVLHDVDVDIVFTEAQLPGMDGVELAWVLRRFHAAPAVVFVTRCPRRAADAFDVGAIDYLSKPPPPDRLARSLRRVAGTVRHARAITPAAMPAPRPAPATMAPAPADTHHEVIPVETGGTTKLVRRSAVRWVQAVGDYARLHTADGSHLIRARMARLAECWQAAGLVRIHRSYLVQLRYVADVRITDSGQMTVLVDGHQLPVSRRQAPRVRSQMLGAAYSCADR